MSFLNRFNAKYKQLPCKILCLILLSSCLAKGTDPRTALPFIPPDDSFNTTDETPVLDTGRPTGKITINPNVCACLEGKTESTGNCTSFCRNKNVKEPTLYATATLDSSIELNPAIGDLPGWCNNEIGDGLVSPNCTLEAMGADRSIETLEVNILSGGNAFTANISALAYDTNYVMTLVESGSGSDARTKNFHFRRELYDPDKKNKAALNVVPVHMYECIMRSGIPSTKDFTDSVRQHFFYNHKTFPDPQPDNEVFNVCHADYQTTKKDRAGLPRINNRQNVFFIWDEADFRFYDNDPQNDQLDINDQIAEQRRKVYGERDVEITPIFAEFKWPSDLLDGNNLPVLGYIMVPFVDADTGETFCPGFEQYNRDNVPLFNAIGDFIGVETEGLYLGVGEGKAVGEEADAQVIVDLMLIREGMLNDISFYFTSSGMPVRAYDDENNVPTAAMKGGQPIFFYWPPDIDSSGNVLNPTTRKGDSVLYQVKHPTKVSEANDRVGLRTSILPQDKRFACIPQTQVED